MVYRISVDEYERIVAAGALDDPRVELINGQIVPMTPIGDAHASCVRRLIGLLSRRCRR